MVWTQADKCKPPAGNTEKEGSQQWALQKAPMSTSLVGFFCANQRANTSDNCSALHAAGPMMQ
eukprot:5704314-Amphidinium_carterae.1